MSKTIAIARTLVPMVLGLAVGACSAATQKGPRTIQITTDACAELATLYDQQDLAQICETASDASPLFEELFKRAKAGKGCAAAAGQDAGQ